MKKIETMYYAFYDALYNERINAPGAAAAFDAAMANDPDFKKAVLDFVAARLDPISSDREAAAFYLAYTA